MNQLENLPNGIKKTLLPLTGYNSSQYIYIVKNDKKLHDTIS